MKEILKRAQGCLIGQLAGDSLGSLVEFESPETIREKYPDGIKYLSDGGTFKTIAGQPTDDSELALMLARTLVRNKIYNLQDTYDAYLYWLKSEPFDIGHTTYRGLNNQPDYDSQANGALMRISPLGIFGVNYDLETVANWAEKDASITHPHRVCKHTNALYTMAISYAIKNGTEPTELYNKIVEWAVERNVDESLLNVIKKSKHSPPENYMHQAGWVLKTFQNALYQLLHADNLEQGIIDTVMRGGDTDTNACICGALLGAVYGIDSIPEQWLNAILNCKPDFENPKVKRPRPMPLWPNDALELAEKLISRSSLYINSTNCPE